MTLPAQMLDRTGIGNKAREDLSDIIHNISPTDTPFISRIDRTSADSDAHEWPTDALAAARSDNKHVDGDDFSAEGDTLQAGSGFDGVAISAGSRIGNHCQIARKDIVVSRRADKVRKAGRKDELAYQIAKAGRELKRDIESSLLANNNAVQGTTSVAGQTASYLNWIRANSSRHNTLAGTDGADPAALSSGFPTGTAATDASVLRALSETDFLDVLGSCYIAGGDIDCAMFHPLVKQKWSQYMFSPDTANSGRIAVVQSEQGKSPRSGATALGAVDVYVSDFGVISIVPNRFQRSRDIPIFETAMWAVAYLDDIQQFEVAKTGDNRKRVLLADYCLEARNPDGCGIVADIDSSLAMVFETTETEGA